LGYQAANTAQEIRASGQRHQPMTAHNRGPLRGPLGAGGLPISHRAIIFGAMAVGETKITGLLEGQDVMIPPRPCGP
jgi:hypothetical protein